MFFSLLLTLRQAFVYLSISAALYCNCRFAIKILLYSNLAELFLGHLAHWNQDSFKLKAQKQTLHFSVTVLQYLNFIFEWDKQMMMMESFDGK